MTDKQNIPVFEMQTGRPESSRVELLKHLPITLQEELFPSELEALEVLKQFKVSKFFNDRFLMGCLFSRKMDIPRTVKMLKGHIKWRMSNGYERIPKWDDIDKELLLGNFAFLVPGARSKEGYSIIYARLKNLVPSEHGKDYVRKILDIMIWNNSLGTFYENLDSHRNGLIFVADLEGIGLKNIDFNLQRKINSTLMDNFPLRIRKVLLVNPPSIIETIIAGVRLFMKKKLMDRIQIIDKENLVEHIDPDCLLTTLGGNLEFTAEHYISYMNDVVQNQHIEFKSLKKKEKVKKISQSSKVNHRKVSKSELKNHKET